jgi:MoxR-like ATPase
MAKHGAYTDKQVRDFLADGTLIALNQIGRELQAVAVDGRDVTDMINRFIRKKAFDAGKGLMVRYTKTGGVQWRQVSVSDVEAAARITPQTTVEGSTPTAAHSVPTSEWSAMGDDEVKDFVGVCVKYRPDELIISDLKWKYLMRSAIRGENILMVGPSGCGKTMACYAVHKTFPNRPFFKFNLGATQDPRGYLIGNTHYRQGKGTIFSDALFVQAIQTPGAIILLDEISRAHDDASNILMTVLDKAQRYLRIDEKPDTPTIPVAAGVVFLSTANIGNEYTGTRVMDRALLDRFEAIIEMDPLGKDEELGLLKKMFPSVELRFVEAIAEIATYTREQARGEDPKVSTVISTRVTLAMAGLLKDSFGLAEVAEVLIYPFYSEAGGADSERTHMKQLVQKYLPTEFDNKASPWQPADDDDQDNKVPWNQS